MDEARFEMIDRNKDISITTKRISTISTSIWFALSKQNELTLY